MTRPDGVLAVDTVFLSASFPSVGPPETDWARAYERSLVNPWARFPLDGDIYEALDDTPVSFMTHWRAPFTGGGSGTVPQGTEVRVKVFDSMPRPISVYASPLETEVIERLLVPESERKDPNYGGFSLSIPVADLNRLFRLVSTHQKSAVQQSSEGSDELALRNALLEGVVVTLPRWWRLQGPGRAASQPLIPIDTGGGHPFAPGRFHHFLRTP